jgi:hypothetical protein
MPLPLAAVPAIAQSVGGLFQTLFSGRKKAQREMEAQLNNSPAYTPNKGISDYYQESLNRYNENPQQSAIYQNAVRNAQRTTAQGIGALQDRRSALAGVGRLAAIQNDAMANATAQAESRRDARFSQLGQATNMKAGEERRAFDINVLTPYQRRLQMAQMKASAANARSDAGMQNMFSGLSNISTALSQKPSSTQGQNLATGSVMQSTVAQPKMGALSSFGSMKNITNFKQPNIQQAPYVAGGNFFNNPIPYAD